ncbi:MAG: fibronectin type III domain-containing protein [Deltaproteobacteria bacterium]|jgi:hypothetical protein|nr:fibronectin type III domain-containing protein [Deltaproteobacteria bacterium]
MNSKVIAIAVIGIFLAATSTCAFAQFGGAPGIGAPMSTLLPGPPRNVCASVSKGGTVSVSFYPPKSNGIEPIKVYTVTSHPGHITVQGTKSPILVAGLINGQTYTFTVTATTNIGTGLSSERSNPVTPN